MKRWKEQRGRVSWGGHDTQIRDRAQHSVHSVSTLLTYKSSFVYWTPLSLNVFLDPGFKYQQQNNQRDQKVLFVAFLLLCFTTKCAIPLICTTVLRLSTSVVMYFLDRAVPAHWSRAIWNLCLFALGTVPSIQSHWGELKPSSSVPNNEWSSNVLTPALTHRPSCFPAPACINRSVYSGVRTSFLWSPLWALHCYSFGAAQVSPQSQSIQPIDDDCHFTFLCLLSSLFLLSRVNLLTEVKFANP